MSRLVTEALSNRWVMQNVPAFHPEPYMTTPDDYISSLQFELHQTQFDPARPQPVTSTWEKITTELLKHEHFGELLRRTSLAGEFSNSSPLTAAATALPARYTDLSARAAAALGLVQNAVRFSGAESMYASVPDFQRHVTEHPVGNSADVNLLLVHTLRDAGLEAHPLLLSTRTHGQVQTAIPQLGQFNYVVAYVALPDQQYLLLDATEPLAAAGTLPERCLNGQGRLIAPAGRWVPLTPTQKHLSLTNAHLDLTPQGQLRGKVLLEYSGYAAIQERLRLAQAGEKAYLSHLLTHHSDWQLAHAAIKRTDELASSLLLDLDLSVTTPEPKSGKLYLPILQLLTSSTNPFQHDTRAFPVDFGMAHEYITTLILTLPTGYKPVELPAKLMFDLPNGGGQYVYEAQQQGSTLQVSSRLLLRKALYQPSEYAALRELFVRSIAKHAEPLVLQKTL
jgi:hypothetical protein